MDKDNQHENPFEENNLPQNNGLPPIWDNISEELDASEGLDTYVEESVIESDLEHIADVADFSVVKEGFEQTFKVAAPPKFMWDQIEQGLESFIETDDPSAFSAIKEGFEQTYKESAAPLFTWDHLAEEIDKPEQPVVEEDYSVVKSGFEKQYSAVVLPLFTWDDLAQRMDSEAAMADTADNYTIIKESFEKQFQAKKPAAATWASIQQQLNLQTVWGRFSYAVQNIAYREWAKKAMFVGTVALLIGTGRACMNEDVSNSPLAKEMSHTQAGTELDSKNSLSDQNSSPSKKHLEHAIIGLPENENTTGNSNETNGTAKYFNVNPSNIEHLDQGNKNHETANTDVVAPQNAKVTTTDNNKETANLAVANGADPSGKEDKKANTNLIENNELVNPATEFPLENTNVDAPNTSSKQEEPKEQDYASSLLEEYKAWLSDYANTTYQSKIALTDQDFQQLFDANFIAEWKKQDITLDFSETKFPLLNKNQIENTAFDDMREFVEHQGVKRTQKTKRLTFEIGVVGRGGTSILLGENSNQAFSSEHSSTTQLHSSRGLGFQFNAGITAHDGLVLGIYPYSMTSQKFNIYAQDGAVETRKAKLSFLDFTVGYQRTLIRYNNLHKFPAKIYARLDLGLGYLTNGTLLVDGTAVETDDLFNKLNVSLGLALGNTHEFGSVLLDYGLVGNVGLNQIINPAANNGELLAPANLLNVGAYVGVRYRLFRPWNPNKAKYKQFEWSDPFYVEIPIP